MKTKLLLMLLAAQSLLTAQSARDIDLEVTFVKPDTNETIYVPTKYPLQFKVKNNGPDILKSGDILRFYTWNTDTGTRGAFKYFLTANYKPGESFLVKHDIPINKDLDADFYRIGLICDIYNKTSDSIKTEWGVKFINNQPDIVVRIKLKSNATNPLRHTHIPILFYPNPAADILQFKQVIAEVSIYNISGQKALSLNQPGSTIDISGLPQGLYFLEATLPDGKTKKQGKFIKQ